MPGLNQLGSPDSRKRVCIDVIYQLQGAGQRIPGGERFGDTRQDIGRIQKIGPRIDGGRTTEASGSKDGLTGHRLPEGRQSCGLRRRENRLVESGRRDELRLRLRHSLNPTGQDSGLRNDLGQATRGSRLDHRLTQDLGSGNPRSLLRRSDNRLLTLLRSGSPRSSSASELFSDSWWQANAFAARSVHFLRNTGWQPLWLGCISANAHILLPSSLACDLSPTGAIQVKVAGNPACAKTTYKNKNKQ
jgi:hypothetical protein